MDLKEIAKRGLKGRKKDSLLISLVIILAFIFIITSTIFKSSTEKTKLEQKLDLYGEYHASYLEADEKILEKLKKEKAIDKIGKSLIVGQSEKAGVVGSFDKELLEMGRFTLYKGAYPSEDNEIMLEINQMSKMGLELETGQKINIKIEIPNTIGTLKAYIKDISRELRSYGLEDIEGYKSIESEWHELLTMDTKTSEEERKRQERIDELYEPIYREQPIKSLKHHEMPHEKIGDTTITLDNDYVHYYLRGDDIDPSIIREKGFLEKQKIIITKEFIVSGILNTYTDKWALDDFKSPNAFISQEAAEDLRDAVHNTKLGDFKNIRMSYNIFLKSDSLGESLYDKLSKKYPQTKEYKKSEELDTRSSDVAESVVGSSEEEIEDFFKQNEELSLNVGRMHDDTYDKTLEGNERKGIVGVLNISKFRKNYRTFGREENTDYALNLIIIAVIFIATALAIFQIFLTQMKRRSRKLVLLRSIGATRGQIIKLIFYEGLHFLKNGLLIGIPFGFLLSVIIVFMVNSFGERDLRYFINPTLLLVGILAGILSLFVGMIVPMIYAVSIPLTGTISRPPRRKKKDYRKERKIKYQSFKRITIQNLKINRGKTLLSFIISSIAATILMSSLFLVFSSFDGYKEAVLKKDKPNFVMEKIYGEVTRELTDITDEIKKIEEVKELEAYKVGKDVLLWYEGIEDNKILNTFEKLLPLDFKKNYFSKYKSGLARYDKHISDAFYTKIYGIEAEGELFDKYNSMLTEGQIDPESFKRGKEVILMTPIYSREETKGKKVAKEDLLENTNESNRMQYIFKKSGTYDMTYDNRFRDYYDYQSNIKPGEEITLSADLESLSGDAYSDTFKTEKATVTGKIDYIPINGLWPFSNNNANYVLISSIEAMENLYPASRSRMRNMSLENIRFITDTMFPTKYGRTILYIRTNTNRDDPVLNSKLLSFAHERNYTLYNYNESNSKLYQEAFNNALIIALLGLTASAISIMILYNIMVSKADQDRNRTGILQSLGVTSGHFKRELLKIGFINASLSLILAHIVLFLALLIGSKISLKSVDVGLSGVLKDIFSYRLWLYPWSVHITISIIFLLLVTLIFYLPSRKIIGDSPVNNIRSLNR